MFARNLTPLIGRHLWSATTCRRFPKRVEMATAQAATSASEKRRRAQRAPRTLQSRAGMTLTELLVVVAIMVILIGMAVPMMRNGLEERKLREASRQLNGAFALAKAMAAETGRAAGVWIDTQSGTSYAQQVFLTETPAPFGGDIVGATATVTNASPLVAFDASKTFSLQLLVSVNDLIKFDYKGPFYRISAIPSNTSVTIDTTGLTPPVAGTYLYQIFRQPAKSSSMPLELPAAAVIDLDWSGYGLPFLFFPQWMQSYAYSPGDRCRPTTPNGFYYVAVSVSSVGGTSGSTEPNWPTVTGQTVVDGDVTWRCFGPAVITVMFNPNGSVERLWIVGGGAPMRPTETLHFLVGKIEQAGTTSGNLQDNTCLWVSVSPQTGRVTTAENAYDANSATPVPTARQFAQSGQTMGGR